MKPLVAKEMRLLMPAYIAALVLAVVPVWLLPKDPHNTAAAMAVHPYLFGVLMLGLSAFGREFSLNTFGLVLAQPVERREVWQTLTSSSLVPLTDV